MRWPCLAAAGLALVLSGWRASSASAQPAAPPPADAGLEVPAPAASSAVPRTPLAPPPAVPSASAAPDAVPPPPGSEREITELRARVEALETKAANEHAHPDVRSDPPTST